ncbi:outer membrane lipoprotein-sorting protein [sulfur-oxidizing endosymbiont of Gigantopelta aegis]|uniref:outer membrane lipoprotein-sorting protein n=1 Tax=sulfur-oxidizing endosymbiont of Gigantopelta aegis TaxID=2794934 RepID=UPI0018DC2061|nr:outer membrane lipoprotein-sorting protein [sulfur-oxidizing endosymbiont of Gigantopelta aegis]
MEQTSSPDALTLMLAEKLRDTGNNERADISMILIDAKGAQRERKLIRLRVSDGREQKIRLQFQFPPDLRDTALLLHDHSDRDDDRWLYLPTLRKAKRISGAQKYRHFLGTDFTYDELGGREPEEDKHQLLGEEILDNKVVYKIKSIPIEQENPYQYRLTWLEKTTSIILKEEYFDRHGRLKKRMLVNNIQSLQGIPTILEREMQDIQQQHRTVLKFSQVKYNTDISSRFFHSRQLDRPIK